MKNVLFVGDLHLSSKTPLSRIDNYGNTVLKKLESLLGVAIKYSVDTIIFTGDFFDSYYEPISYMNKVVEVLTKFKDKNIQVLSLIGNHDLPYNNMEYFNSTPLSLLFKSKLVYRLDFLENDKVEIFGLHFSEKEKLASIKTSPEKTSILVMHYAFNNTVPGESISEAELTTFDTVIAGHDHMFYKPYITADENTLVLRPGSFTRMTKDSYNLTRDILVYYYESDTNVVNAVKLPEVDQAANVFSNKVFSESSLNLYNNDLSALFDNNEVAQESHNIFDIVDSLTMPVTTESKKTITKFLEHKGIIKNKK